MKNISPSTVLSADNVMRDLVSSHPAPRIGMNPIFFSLVRAIISQQLSEAAASAIFKRLSAIAAITPETLSNIDVETFRTCGISSRKAEYIKGIAEATLKGQLEHIADLSDDYAIKELVSLKAWRLGREIKANLKNQVHLFFLGQAVKYSSLKSVKLNLPLILSSISFFEALGFESI